MFIEVTSTRNITVEKKTPNNYVYPVNLPWFLSVMLSQFFWKYSMCNSAL